MDQTGSPLNSSRTSILGVPVDAVNMELTLDAVRQMLASSETSTIVAVNPEKVIAAQNCPDLMRALENASLVIPDGIGVVLGARLLGTGRMERVAGADLMPEICSLAAAEGQGVFLYGSKQEIVSKAKTLLEEGFPNLRVVGIQNGYLPDGEMDQLIKSINESGAGVLFVGLGSPKQELWLNRYATELNVRVCQCVGGSFDALCGYPKRAPKLLREFHLEWLYRLVSQPMRAHRQLALPHFAAQVLRSAIRKKS
jgi:N-acetylglucosaminyldiphosphoundecaprenol N-acetyl-beta-D-mannosaminyltransferase